VQLLRRGILVHHQSATILKIHLQPPCQLAQYNSCEPSAWALQLATDSRAVVLLLAPMRCSARQRRDTEWDTLRVAEELM
jgi:hypothetical protein